MNKTWIIWLIFIFFSLSLNAKNFGIIPVDVYKVKIEKTTSVDITYPARLRSFKKAVIVARVRGFLEKKYFKEGEYVEKGKILYLIEPDTYIAEYNLAVAELNKAVANLKKAERDWIRAQKSFKDNVISVDKYDAYKYAYEMAKAEVDAAKARVKKAEINLNYTKVKATISGYTGTKFVDVGNYVVPGTPLVKITELNPLYAYFSVPDVDFFKIKNLKDISVNLIVNGKLIKNGKLDFKDVNIDEKTSTVKFRAIFDNSKQDLMPGEFVRVELKGFLNKRLIKIPQKALLQNALAKIVYVVKNGKVAVKEVKIGKTIGDYIVIKKGLKEGDLVIVDNFFKIRPGIPVKIDKIIK